MVKVNGLSESEKQQGMEIMNDARLQMLVPLMRHSGFAFEDSEQAREALEKDNGIFLMTDDLGGLPGEILIDLTPFYRDLAFRNIPHNGELILSLQNPYLNFRFKKFSRLGFIRS